MREFMAIIAINLLIAGFLWLCGNIYLKWLKKKRNYAYLEALAKDPEIAQFFDERSAKKLRKRIAEYDRKHPFKAMKRKLKEKTRWLFD